MSQDFDNSDWSLRPPGFKPSPTGLLTRRELADCLAVDAQTVGKWERTGLPVALVSGAGRPSYFSELEVRAWLEDRAEKAGTRSAGASDAVTARAQRDLWQARLAEQQHRLRARELLDASAISTVWAAEISAVRALILNLPASRADRVYRASIEGGVAGVEGALKAAVYEALRELATEGRPLPTEAADPATPVAATTPEISAIGRDAFVPRGPA